MMSDAAADDGAASIRPCGAADRGAMLVVINAAAQAYRGVIPADRWHNPYMPPEELAAEIAAGVVFSGCERGAGLVGVMGVQRRHNVDLIRHAYVLPAWQGRGVGAALLRHIRRDADRPMLVGTWRAAAWAVRFYERHGFAAVDREDIAPLLRTYWSVPARQVETSVVLASPPLGEGVRARLIAAVPASAETRKEGEAAGCP